MRWSIFWAVKGVLAIPVSSFLPIKKDGKRENKSLEFCLYLYLCGGVNKAF